MILLTNEEIMDIEEAVEDAVFLGQATDTKSGAIAKAQLKRVVKIIMADKYFVDDLWDGDTPYGEPERILVSFSLKTWKKILKEIKE